MRNILYGIPICFLLTQNKNDSSSSLYNKDIVYINQYPLLEYGLILHVELCENARISCKLQAENMNEAPEMRARPQNTTFLLQ